MERNKKKTPLKEWLFYALTVAIFLFLAGKGMLSTGMFTDGLLYDCIAQNMADGIGSLWHPVCTETYFNDFHEHPTLAFFLLSLFYRLLGGGLWVCRLYSLLMFAITGMLILHLWRYVSGSMRNAWIPLLLWVVTISVARTSYSNLLEVTKAPLVLGSVLMTLRAYNTRLLSSHVCILIASGMLLAAAFFTKGFTGLYPLAFPFILASLGYGAQYKTRWYDRLLRGIADTVYIAIGLVVPVSLVLLLNDDAMKYMTEYYNWQVVQGMDVATVSSRGYIVSAFLERTIIVWIILALLLANRWVGGLRTGGLSYQMNHKSLITALLLLTLCGVLPMMLSLKQRSFYILTVYPFFATAVAAIISPSIEVIIRRGTTRRGHTVMYCIVLILLGGACAYQSQLYGKPDRDAVMQSDAKIISTHLKTGERVALPPAADDDPSLHGYYYRDYRVSLDQNDTQHQCRYLLVPDKALLNGTDLDTFYEEVPLETEQYKLYKHK